VAEGDLIPSDQHVLRHAGASKVVDGRAQGSAFLLRNGETGLSVNWLEHARPDGTRAEQCIEVRTALVATGRTVRPNDWLLVVQVERISAITELAGTACTFVATHHPIFGNDSHSEIVGLPPPGSALATLAGAALADAIAEAPMRVGSL
jgi:hypothetical protein